jgi:hypothetical protein
VEKLERDKLCMDHRLIMLEDVRERGFWGRLRWLLLGR